LQSDILCLILYFLVNEHWQISQTLHRARQRFIAKFTRKLTPNLTIIRNFDTKTSSNPSPNSGGSRPGVWGAVKLVGSQKSLHFLQYQRLSATIVRCHTEMVTFGVQKPAVFIGRTTRFFKVVSGN